ncbi:transmembrane amino acid transporter protein-domain-containing protein [Radiomyces spectabilis]|uniref:transmembrane amino acid transporter protein-domain-containing protein n=1 Tax=Radiomyces spectabilis TaxID=64574 RepID=UPI00221E92B7|nr:transmembrane amino acid transporter protein-domain-containing protein [Radiomyces spectabilis]KAI8394123.1 transmembrane amino acid transporter protein-domain-containing protein [Radiomyces spectabilis]
MSIEEKKYSGGVPDAYKHDIASEHEYNIEEFADINREHAGSGFLAYFNIVCVIAGTGTLGLPYALKQGGWIGLLILFLAWTMSVYTGVILIRCLYANGKHRISSYKEIATESFGAIGGWITFFFNAWILLGAPVLYVVLSGANLAHLCQNTVAEVVGATNWTIISCVLVLIPFVLVKSMKEVAWMSAFGALTVLVVVLIVLVMACIDQKNQVNVHHDPVIWDQFPIALSTISFSFGGNVVYPNVEASMKKPKQWPKVVAAGMSTCALMYFLTAIPGYYIYGDAVKSPIYDSIPAGVGQIIAVVLMTIHVLISAPILVTSFALDLEEMMNITVERFGRFREFIIRALLRIAIIVVIAIIGCFVPYFDNLMSFIGAFANCALIFIFPIIFYLKLTGVRNKPIYELLWCLLIVILGVVGLIFGSWQAIDALKADIERDRALGISPGA